MTKGLQLSQLCDLLRESGLTAELEGADCLITGVNTLEDASESELSFLANAKYARTLRHTKASAVLVAAGVTVPDGLSTIRCDDPYAAVTVAISKIHGHRKHPQWGISDRATIDPSAKIGENANIAGGVTVGRDVEIGDNCTIYPGVYVADGVRIGNDCTLYPNVVIYDDCVLGDRVAIHAGSVIGEDGLGYAPVGDTWLKIPQVGRAVLGDDVEIGANCSIDRATLGQTEIGSGTKFGNAVLISHGTKVGPNCLFVGLVGVAGSATIGRHVTLAGQVGVGGHLSIGDEARVGGKAGVMGDVEAGTEVLGAPAIPIAKARRSFAAIQKLPEWIKRIKDLEREVAELKKKGKE